MLKRVVAVFLLLLPLPIQAQEALPLPPDPAALFAPDVEVLKVEINFSTFLDNEARTIQVLDQSKRVWQTFTYPPHFKRINDAKLEDGLVLLDVTELDTTSSQFWILNPTTSEFKRHENACLDWERDNQISHLNLTLRSHWEFYHDNQLSRISLCNTSTGKSEFLLPKDTYWQWIDETRSSKWLILWNSDDAGVHIDSILHVYSYNTEARQLIYLGDVPLREMPEWHWINDNEGLYYAGSGPESTPREILYVDMSKPNSLIYFMNGWAGYHNDPPYYEYLQTYYQVSHRQDLYGNYPKCQVDRFDFAQQEAIVHSYPLSKDCFGNVVRNQNHYFYVAYGEAEPTTLTLYSLDTETQERKTWFADTDLLALDSISPDGRYAILMLNDGNWPPVKFADDYPSASSIPIEELDPWIYPYHGLVSSHMAIYDTQLGKIVYDNPAWEFYGSMTWVDNTSFLSEDGEDQRPITLFRFIDQDLVQVETALTEHGSPNLSPNNQLAILEQESQFVVYNSLTGKTIPLMNGFQSDDFDFNMEWIDNQHIRVDFWRVKRLAFEKPAVIYTIAIPQV